jgi:pilus assembly protein Flp/PilA
MAYMVQYLSLLLNRFRREEEGQAMVEYGILVAVIAVVVAAAAVTLGTEISTVFSNLAAYLKTIPSTP